MPILFGDFPAMFDHQKVEDDLCLQLLRSKYIDIKEKQRI